MQADFGEDGLIKLGVAGALAREYSADAKAFLGFFASAMQNALGDDVEVTYRGGFLTKKTVQSVSLLGGENRFILEDPGKGPLQAKMVHTVRGIALKTQLIDIETWLSLISDVIEAKAQTQAATARSLKGILGLE